MKFDLFFFVVLTHTMESKYKIGQTVCIDNVNALILSANECRIVGITLEERYKHDADPHAVPPADWKKFKALFLPSDYTYDGSLSRLILKKGASTEFSTNDNDEYRVGDVIPLDLEEVRIDLREELFEMASCWKWNISEVPFKITKCEFVYKVKFLNSGHIGFVRESNIVGMHA